MKPETKAIHIPAKRYEGSIAPPINLTTTFEHGPANELLHGYQYVRHGNPNVSDLETRLTALEGGIGAVAFSSGMAAGIALLNSLTPGSTVVLHQTIYFDFLTFARSRLRDWGITAKIIDCRDERALSSALADGASLVWFGTSGAFGIREARRITKSTGESIDRRYAALILSLGAGAFTLNALNVVAIQEAWPYLAGLVAMLTLPFSQFLRLLRGVLRSS